MNRPISRDDIEKSLRSIQTGVTEKVRSKRTRIVQGVAVGSIVFVMLVYLVGRRSGRKRTTVVEIRRV